MAKSSTQINIKTPWAKSLDKLTETINIDLEKGLDQAEVDALQKEFGKNRLKTEEEKNYPRNSDRSI